MSKTKVIDVWLGKDMYIENGEIIYGNYHTIYTQPTHFAGDIQAKLIIEIPEKRITITESEFDKVYNDWVKALNVVRYHKNDHLKNMKKDLGF